DVEGVQGGFPPVAPAFPSSPGGVEADDGEVEVLEGGLLGGEVAAGFDRAADPRVEGLDRVGLADDRPYLPVEGQERDELGPGVLPEPEDRRVLLFPGAAGLGGRVESSGLGRGGVYRLEVLGELAPVLLAGVAEAVAQQVHDAVLGDGLRP